MTSQNDPMMTPVEALEDAATQPENLYYPYHILDQGNLRFIVALIYGHQHVSGKLTWGEAKSLVLRLNDPSSNEYLPAPFIPLLDGRSAADYLIARLKSVQVPDFEPSLANNDDYIMERGEALTRRRHVGFILKEMMEIYVSTISQSREKPMGKNEMREAWRDAIFAKEADLTGTMRTIRQTKGITWALQMQIDEVTALLEEI